MQRLQQWLTIERTAIIILGFLLWFIATDAPTDADMWWHLRSGQWILEEGRMLYEDPFSHTFAGEYRVNYSWLSQIVLYGFWSAAGYGGMIIYTALLAVGGLAVLSLAMRGSVYINGLLLVICAAASAVFWSPRPQMMSFFLSTVMIAILFNYKYRGIDRTWAIPPIMLLWANLHAGYVIGLIILGGIGVGEILNNLLRKDKTDIIPWASILKLFLLGVLSLALMLINPNGLNLLLVPFRTVSIEALQRFIQEWQPPALLEPAYLPFTLLLILTPLSLLISRRRIDFSELVLLIGTGYLALAAARNVSFFAVIATPILSLHLYTFLQRRGWTIRPGRRATPVMVAANLLLILSVGLGALINTLVTARPAVVEEELAQVMPVGATDYLNSVSADLKGQMYNSYNWGGYLMFHAPQIPVFIDGRTDLYFDFILDYIRVATGRDDWRPLFEAYDIGFAVTEVEGDLSALTDALREETDWRLVYEDDLAAVFADESRNAPVQAAPAVADDTR